MIAVVLWCCCRTEAAGNKWWVLSLVASRGRDTSYTTYLHIYTYLHISTHRDCTPHWPLGTAWAHTGLNGGLITHPPLQARQQGWRMEDGEDMRLGVCSRGWAPSCPLMRGLLWLATSLQHSSSNILISTSTQPQHCEQLHDECVNTVNCTIHTCMWSSWLTQHDVFRHNIYKSLFFSLNVKSAMTSETRSCSPA